MWRALAKGAGLFAFGWTPGGANLYRTLTREWAGTQATHADKLERVWPVYIDAWRARCGVRDFEGRSLWSHEGGWTPFPSLMHFMLTGSGGTVTNVDARLLDRYVARAVNANLDADLPGDLMNAERRDRIEALRWKHDAHALVTDIGGTIHHGVNPAALPLADASVDLCHSGGVLEHYRPLVLQAFARESWRVLRPGGIASHVVDHRDHLHHADNRWPFLAHLALPGPFYTVLCGHRLLYHNRLLPEEVATTFVDAGFERIALLRMILPGRRIAEGDEVLTGRRGLHRSLLAPQFRHASDADLHTAAVHYLFRKPP